MPKINASIVRYRQPETELQTLIQALLQSEQLNKVFIIDNSPIASNAFAQDRVEYIYTGNNIGYGPAHNLALQQSIDAGVDYHIVVNPDIALFPDTIEKLTFFMDENPDIGHVMPKIIYVDGRTQYLCKMLSTPFDLLGRRFLIGPLSSLYSGRLFKYELRHKNYEEQMEVPNLSGCFMFLRTSVLKQSGLFDERFFMYLEDIDLTRRIHRVAKTVYYPQAKVCHGYAKGSYKNPKLLFYHIRSAIKYFNKWGWLFDKERRLINAELSK